MASDVELLEAARGGDRAALDALLRRYDQRIYRFGMKMCGGDAEDARDVLQETMLQLARSLRDLRGESSLSTWLYAVARSFCVKARRRSKFAPTTTAVLDEATPIADGRASPEEEAARRQLLSVVERALAELEPQQREVLLLRDGEGLSAAEVARVVGASEEAVKSRLHRARVAIRDRAVELLGERPARPCPEMLELVSRRLEGDISAERCREVQAHLDGCTGCREACDSLGRVLRACSEGPARVPPDVERDVRQALAVALARP